MQSVSSATGFSSKAQVNAHQVGYCRPPLVREDAPCGEAKRFACLPKDSLSLSLSLCLSLSLSLSIPSLYLRSSACLAEFDRSSSVQKMRLRRARPCSQTRRQRILYSSHRTDEQMQQYQYATIIVTGSESAMLPHARWSLKGLDPVPLRYTADTHTKNRPTLPAPGAVRPRPTLPLPLPLPARDYRFCCIHAGIFLPSSTPPPPPLALAASSRCCNHLHARTALYRLSFLINPLSRAFAARGCSNVPASTSSSSPSHRSIPAGRHRKTLRWTGMCAVCVPCVLCVLCAGCVCVCTWVSRPRWPESAPSPVAEFHTWQLLARRSSGLHHSRRPPAATCAGGGESRERETDRQTERERERERERETHTIASVTRLRIPVLLLLSNPIGTWL